MIAERKSDTSGFRPGSDGLRRILHYNEQSAQDAAVLIELTRQAIGVSLLKAACGFSISPQRNAQRSRSLLTLAQIVEKASTPSTIT